MMNKITFSILMISSFVLSGCSVFAIGQNSGQCESEGCNYSEAGVCNDTITVYLNKRSLVNKKVKTGIFD